MGICWYCDMLWWEGNLARCPRCDEWACPDCIDEHGCDKKGNDDG